MPETSPVDRFFSDLARGGHVPLLERTSGTLLIELADGRDEESRRWFVRITRGDVTVSHQSSLPDCVLSTDVPTFEAIISGDINAFAAMLRGLLEVDGQIHLLVALQALFRPSSGATDQPTAGYARERR